MAKEPYPGWAPSYRVVDRVAGQFRTCLVIDLRSDEPLSRTQMLALAERLEATAERGEGAVPGLRAVLVTPDQFDPVVCEGLRLPRTAEGGRAANQEVPLQD